MMTGGATDTRIALACGRMRCSPCCYMCVSEMTMLYIGQSKSQCVLSQSHTSNSPLARTGERLAFLLLPSVLVPGLTPSTSHLTHPAASKSTRPSPIFVPHAISLSSPLPPNHTGTSAAEQASHTPTPSAHTQTRCILLRFGSSFRPSVPERA